MKLKTKIFTSLCGLLSLGTLITTTAFACAGSKNQKGNQTIGLKYTIFPTYVSQADNLLALGISPDYYPTQVFWDKNRPYDYINALNEKDFKTYIYDKPNFADGLAKKLNNLEKEIKTFEPSWFSLSGNNENEGRNEEYWFFNKGGFVLYDRYLLEDTNNTVGGGRINVSGGPIDNNSFVAEVDYKTSRDLFLSLNSELIKNYNDINSPLYNDPLAQKLREGLVYKDEKNKQLYPLHNFSSFARDVNNWYFHNPSNLSIQVNGQDVPFDFWTSNFAKFVIGVQYDKKTNQLTNKQNEIPLFYPSADWKETNSLNSKIYHFFNELLLTQKDKDAGVKNINYQPAMCDHDAFTKDIPQCDNVFLDNSQSKSILQHHPVYEQNLKINGDSQIYLGSIRESMLYLYKIAYAASAYAQTTQAKVLLKDKPQKLILLKNALTNANEIAGNLSNRIEKMRKLFQLVGLVDKRYDPINYQFNNQRSKTIGLLTTFERNGTNTLQTISKYGFLYYDLGFRQPRPRLIGDSYKALLDPVDNKVPKGCHKHDDGTTHCENAEGEDEIVKQIDESVSNSILNMDAHGWWWNLGDGGLTETNFAKFKGNFDYIFNLTKNKEQVFKNPSENVQVNLLLKSYVYEQTVSDPEVLSNHIFLEDYTLWTEGIRSPIGYNQILDAVLKHLLNTSEVQEVVKKLNPADQVLYNELIKESVEWGSYWQGFIRK
ncbi:iron ABC transporter substrate-binding protein [Ureaplasma sp. ES3154-GEN]|uniref:iron ABC transporter substrate-binding protein n=1 Tax=Ureaplasma sp. ES3154-GEN TaxID=2984844 RepID=UPI0021E7EC35|nr:iron ABC transporter substrate-binding protein [Ureaplasma sp. ES3154-GEN]MCV3743575.1 iron ABC transporter substrate-binding protein [Ureaplasma sp. ES3154-GEN]